MKSAVEVADEIARVLNLGASDAEKALYASILAQRLTPYFLALKYAAKGYCLGENKNMECKTVGNFHEEMYGPGNHCPVCWMNEAQKRAEAALTA